MTIYMIVKSSPHGKPITELYYNAVVANYEPPITGQITLDPVVNTS